MRAIYIDDISKRSDGKQGKPTRVTLFKEYTVIKEVGDKFTIINDKEKLARYNKSRFVILDNLSVL